MSGPVERAYRELVGAGELKPDEAQGRAVEALDRLARALQSPPPRCGCCGSLRR